MDCGYEYDTNKNTDNHASDVYTYEANDKETHKKIHECGVVFNASEAHTFVDDKCKCGKKQINAVSMSAEELQAAITELLAMGETDIRIRLASGASDEMFTAIAVALAADGIATGSIDLTISGATSIPDEVFWGNEYVNDNYKASAVLKSVFLPDATTIGMGVFFACGNMTSVSAPKAITIGDEAFEGCYSLAEVNLPLAQTIGMMAFSECSALKEISLPECTSIGVAAFNVCQELETFYAPKATTIGSIAFHGCDALKKVTFGALFSVAGGSDAIFLNGADTKNIDLILACDQKAMTYDNSTEIYTAGTEAFDFNTTSFIGYTFKSVSFVDEN